jgi:hypothetical protein
MTEDKNLSKKTLIITLGIALIVIITGANIVSYYLTGTVSMPSFIVLLTMLPVFLILMKKNKGR